MGAGHFWRMGEMLKSAASARSDLSASSSSLSLTIEPAARPASPARSPPSRGHSAGPSRGRCAPCALRTPPQPQAAPAARQAHRARRGALGRPEVALCLLAEVAYEHDERFRMHLPMSLHTMLVALDAREPLVATRTRAPPAHLLHALPGGRAPLGGAGGGGQVAHTLRHLAVGRGRRLWAAEDASPASSHPSSAAALFEPDLCERWAARGAALGAGGGRPRAVARTLQALGALRPAGGADAAAALTAALAACLACGAPAALDHAGQLLLVLQAMVDAMPPGRLALFPQLVLAALAALCTPNAQAHGAAGVLRSHGVRC